MEIRELTYADLAQIISIERRAFQSPWSLSMFVLEFSKPQGLRLGATLDGALVGYLIVSRYGDDHHVMSLAVDPSHRRQGVAASLLRHLIESIGEHANYTLEVRASNTGAIALYERFGFVSAGVRPHYYPDDGEDAMIMWRAEGRPWE